jgi:hypothetical protein
VNAWYAVQQRSNLQKSCHQVPSGHWKLSGLSATLAVSFEPERENGQSGWHLGLTNGGNCKKAAMMYRSGGDESAQSDVPFESGSSTWS